METEELLVGKLDAAKKEIEYYKTLAKKAGDARLRETEELSQLIGTIRKTEQKLKEARDELEKRVEERTEELSISNMQLQNEIAIRKEAEQRRLTEIEVIEIVNINKTIPLNRLLYEIEYEERVD